MEEYNRRVTVLFTEQQYKQLKSMIILHPERWKNVSEYVRSAALRQQRLILTNKNA